MVKPGNPQMTIWLMRIARWIPKTTNTHSQYVILTVFSLPQWLHERASMFTLYSTVRLVLQPRWRVFTARHELTAYI